MTVLIEVCVDDLAGLSEARRGGADRIELCAALDLGGLTPSRGMMEHAVGCGVPVMAMIRPRAGHFIWSPDEITVMQRDIDAARAAGLSGVVLGAQRPDGWLDRDALRLLLDRAEGMEATLHRCFDLTPDPFAALEEAIALGFRRILTSGQARTAVEGAALIAALVERAAGRIVIMPGSGIRAASVAGLFGLGLQEFHASCALAEEQSGPAVDFGFATRLYRRTDAREVRALRQALAGDGAA